MPKNQNINFEDTSCFKYKLLKYIKKLKIKLDFNKKIN